MSDVHYIAVIHKEPDSSYGVSFPDLPGIIAVGDTLDQAIAEAGIALAFAFEDWVGRRPIPRALETLWQDPQFRREAQETVVAAIKPASNVFQAAE